MHSNVLKKSAPGPGVNQLGLLINKINQWQRARLELPAAQDFDFLNLELSALALQRRVKCFEGCRCGSIGRYFGMCLESPSMRSPWIAGFHGGTLNQWPDYLM